jgi:Rieske Fe-S protein
LRAIQQKRRKALSQFHTSEPVEGVFPRKTFLAAAGGFLAAAIGLPVLIDELAASAPAAAPAEIDLGPVTAFPAGEYTVTTFVSDPAASPVSRRAAFIRNNGLVRGRPSFTILSSRCTHVGCPTQPNGLLLRGGRSVAHTPAGDVTVVPVRPAGFGCPCHGSQFDLEGNRTAGPAVRALDRYRFSIVDGRLVLGEPFSVSRVQGAGANARIAAFPLRDPGQPVSGPEALLYPIGAGR